MTRFSQNNMWGGSLSMLPALGSGLVDDGETLGGFGWGCCKAL